MLHAMGMADFQKGSMQLVSLPELAAIIYVDAWWVATHEVHWFFPELLI